MAASGHRLCLAGQRTRSLLVTRTSRRWPHRAAGTRETSQRSVAEQLGPAMGWAARVMGSKPIQTRGEGSQSATDIGGVTGVAEVVDRDGEEAGYPTKISPAKIASIG